MRGVARLRMLERLLTTLIAFFDARSPGWMVLAFLCFNDTSTVDEKHFVK